MSSVSHADFLTEPRNMSFNFPSLGFSGAGRCCSAVPKQLQRPGLPLPILHQRAARSSRALIVVRSIGWYTKMNLPGATYCMQSKKRCQLQDLHGFKRGQHLKQPLLFSSYIPKQPPCPRQKNSIQPRPLPTSYRI